MWRCRSRMHCRDYGQTTLISTRSTSAPIDRNKSVCVGDTRPEQRFRPVKVERSRCQQESRVAKSASPSVRSSLNCCHFGSELLCSGGWGMTANTFFAHHSIRNGNDGMWCQNFADCSCCFIRPAFHVYRFIGQYLFRITRRFSTS